MLVLAAEKRMPDRALTFGRYRLEPRVGLMRGDREVHLTPKALALLSFIAGCPGEIVAKEDLFCAVWPDVEISVFSNVTSTNFAFDAAKARDPAMMSPRVFQRGLGEPSSVAAAGGTYRRRSAVSLRK